MVTSDFDGNPNRKRDLGLLNAVTVKRMVRRFLVEKQMPKESLAEVLGISVKKLEQLFSRRIPLGLISKINLPLVELYCETKWS